MERSKPYLAEFTTAELQTFIDHYIEYGEILHVPGHDWTSCDMVARFLGFGYSRTWSEEEIQILRETYPAAGAKAAEELLPLRSETDCVRKAINLGLRTLVKKERKKADDWMLWEVDLITRYYPVIGSKVALLLPERSESACVTKAIKLHLTAHSPVPWTEHELSILKDYYPKIGPNISDFLPNKTRNNILSKAAAMGLPAPSQEWTQEEDELLKLHYPQMGAEVSKYFFGRRSRSACISRAAVLGLSFDRYRKGWSEEELRILKEYYPQLGPRVSQMLPERTALSCKKKAGQLKLSFSGSGQKQQRRGKNWSHEELAILAENYPTMGDDVCRLLPHRTRSACITMAQQQKLCKKRGEWTPEEVEILRDNYAKMGNGVVSLLPGRTKSACRNKARELKLYANDSRWTSEEDSILINRYPQEGSSVFNLLPNRSESACRTRLCKLGIQIRKASPK